MNISKKRSRILCFCLAVLMVMYLCIPASAAIEASYCPAYIGYADIDYAADLILEQLPLEGKSNRDKIQLVYDWVITHCSRDGWDGTIYYDPYDYEAEIDAYYYKVLDELSTGKAFIRSEYDDSFWGFDSNDYISTFAGEMMAYRTGNCAHYSALLTVLLNHLGFDCRLIDGYFINNNGTQVEHKWNCVLLDGQYYWLDVRMDHANYTRLGYINHQYFLVSSTSVWEKSHNWDHGYSDWLFQNAAEIAKWTEVQAPWGSVSSWAKPYVEEAYKYGLFPEMLWGKNLVENINRLEFCAVAVAAYEVLTGQPAPEASASPFTDTDAEVVLQAYQLGIVKGVGDGRFAPYDTLTREQAATMLCRVYAYVLGGYNPENYKPSQSSLFVDDAQISSWARGFLYFLVSHNIINGVGDNRFAPLDTLTYEQALKITACMVVES